MDWQRVYFRQETLSTGTLKDQKVGPHGPLGTRTNLCQKKHSSCAPKGNPNPPISISIKSPSKSSKLNIPKQKKIAKKPEPRIWAKSPKMPPILYAWPNLDSSSARSKTAMFKSPSCPSTSSVKLARKRWLRSGFPRNTQQQMCRYIDIVYRYRFRYRFRYSI